RAADARCRHPECHQGRSALPADRHPGLVRRVHRGAGDGAEARDRVRHAILAALRRRGRDRGSGGRQGVLRRCDLEGQAAQAVRRAPARALPRAGARHGLQGPGRLAGRARPRRGAGRGGTMSDRQRLLELLTRLAYEKRKVVLSSGRESDFYIDTKQASLTAEGHALVGRLVMEAIRSNFPEAQAVGGMTMGADPIASAASLTSFLQEPPGIPAFYVRKEPKGHGTAQWLEGKKSLPAGG